MEKTLKNLLNFSNLPSEIQQEIAAYLDTPALGFFAQSSKQTLKNVLPLLVNHQAMFPLLLTSGTSSQNNTFIYQANQIFVCGANNYGQLGLGDQEHRATFTVVPWPANRGRIEQVIADENFTIVLTKDKKLWVCGHNYYVQHGFEDHRNCSSFTATVPLPADQGRIQQIIVGWYYTAVLTKDKRLWVCGYNKYGQLGLGDKERRSTFTIVPWPADRGEIEQVTADGNHTVVLTTDKKLWVCGCNKWGQLGLGDQEHRSTFTAVPWPEDRSRLQQVITGWAHTVVVTDTNQLWVCGNNEYGELGLGDNENRFTFTALPWPVNRGRIKQVILGEAFTFILTDTNQLWVCGDNEWGQLGLGNNENRSTFIAVPWPEEQGRIKQIIIGRAHTVVLTENNRLWVCGDNRYGQLGLGDNENRSTFTPVKEISEVMKQAFTLNNYFNWLIEKGTALTQISSMQSDTLHHQHPPDEPNDQHLLKKRCCNLQ